MTPILARNKRYCAAVEKVENVATVIVLVWGAVMFLEWAAKFCS